MKVFGQYRQNVNIGHPAIALLQLLPLANRLEKSVSACVKCASLSRLLQDSRFFSPVILPFSSILLFFCRNPKILRGDRQALSSNISYTTIKSQTKLFGPTSTLPSTFLATHPREDHEGCGGGRCDSPFPDPPVLSTAHRLSSKVMSRADHKYTAHTKGVNDRYTELPAAAL